MKSFLLFSAVIIIATTTFVSADDPPTVPAQYGSFEAFSELSNDPAIQFWANTPIPAGCPAWVSAEFGILDKIIADTNDMTPSTAKQQWNQYNLSPRIGPDFDVDAFFDVINGAVTISDDFVNNTIFLSYGDMKFYLVSRDLWAQYGAGNTPQCLIVGGEWTVPPMPTDLLSTTETTPYDGPTDPPMPTEPAYTGEPSGLPEFPTYEPGTLIMMIDPSKYPVGNDQLFLQNLQQYVTFPTQYFHVHDDIYDSSQKLISNVTYTQAKVLAAFDSQRLNALGVIYIRIADDSNNFPSADIIPQSDYQMLINITADFERSNPLPTTCPAYLTNDTMLQSMATAKYPATTAVSMFGPIYGPRFDGFNTTCLYLFWEHFGGYKPNCPPDFANVFPTLAPGSGASAAPFPSGSGSGFDSSLDSGMPSLDSNLPSGGSSDIPSGSNSDMPSGSNSDLPSGGSSNMPSGSDSNMPSGSNSDMPSGGDSSMPSGGDIPSPSDFIPGGSQTDFPPPSNSGSGSNSGIPIPTTPSDHLSCKVPFQDYAPCVLAENTLGIILFLRDSKSAHPECFCKGAECLTPPPTTLYPDITHDENGSLVIPTEPPIVTYENESFPILPDNFSGLPAAPTLPDGSLDPKYDPFSHLYSNLPTDESGFPPNSDMPSGGSTTPAPPGPTSTNPPTVGPTPPPGTPTTTTVYNNPNTVAFAKNSQFNMTTFTTKLAGFLGISTSQFTVIPNPRNSSEVIVAFDTGNRNTDATLKQRALAFTLATLNELGTSGASAAAAEGSYTTTAAPGAGAAAPASSNVGAIVGGLLGALVVLGIVGYYIYYNNNKAKKNTSSVSDGYSAHQDFSDFKGNINGEELGAANQQGQFSPTEHSV